MYIIPPNTTCSAQSLTHLRRHRGKDDVFLNTNHENTALRLSLVQLELLPAGAAPCRSCSLPELLPAGVAPCRSCSLPELLPAGAGPCRSCSLPELLPAGAGPCRSCSLPELLIARAIYNQSCKFPELLTIGAAHNCSCSLPELLAAGAARCQSYSLLELLAARATRCWSCSLPELLAAGAARCQSYSLLELLAARATHFILQASIPTCHILSSFWCLIYKKIHNRFKQHLVDECSAYERCVLATAQRIHTVTLTLASQQNVFTLYINGLKCRHV